MKRIISINTAKNTGQIPENYQVWLDFDGTITKQDVIDELLNRYAVNESWKAVEQQWQEGLIGSRQCLKEQLDLIRISQVELDNLLEEIEMDKGIFSLLLLLNEYEVPAVILSDGAETFINRILQRQGIHNIAVRSNTIVHRDSKIEFSCPYNDPKCQSKAAHCKCASIKAIGSPERKSIYIGDGLSDLCPAGKADMVFAKGALAEVMEKKNMKFIRYSNLNEVAEVLRKSWSAQETASTKQVSSKSAAK